MISGAELEFGGGLGVAIFLCAYVCVCVCGKERERLFAGRMMREVQGSQAVSSMVSVASE